MVRDGSLSGDIANIIMSRVSVVMNIVPVLFRSPSIARIWWLGVRYVLQYDDAIGTALSKKVDAKCSFTVSRFHHLNDFLTDDDNDDLLSLNTLGFVLSFVSPTKTGPLLHLQPCRRSLPLHVEKCPFQDGRRRNRQRAHPQNHLRQEQSRRRALWSGFPIGREERKEGGGGRGETIGTER